MIQLFINAFIISFIISFIIGYSLFIPNFKQTIWKILHGNIPYKHFSIKPFDCELCLSFWTVLIVGLFTSVPILYVFAIACIAGFVAPIWTRVLNTIFILITKITK